MKKLQPFQPRKGAALDAQFFEVPANVRLYTFQPCPGGGKVVHVHAKVRSFVRTMPLLLLAIWFSSISTYSHRTLL